MNCRTFYILFTNHLIVNFLLCFLPNSIFLTPYISTAFPSVLQIGGIGKDHVPLEIHKMASFNYNTMNFTFLLAYSTK